jgi:hypothetical protein
METAIPQECDKGAVHFGKNLRNTIPPSGSRGVPPCFIAQAGVHQPAQQDSPTHLLGSVYVSKRLATIGGCKSQNHATVGDRIASKHYRTTVGGRKASKATKIKRLLGIAGSAQGNKTERLLGVAGSAKRTQVTIGGHQASKQCGAAHHNATYTSTRLLGAIGLRASIPSENLQENKSSTHRRATAFHITMTKMES